jgi:hypothetical protein
MKEEAPIYGLPKKVDVGDTFELCGRKYQIDEIERTELQTIIKRSHLIEEDKQC